jgi:thioredoxin reductase
MNEPRKHDLIVIGAGPAGAHAAMAAAGCGLDVLLLDEQPAAGGQIWRRPSSSRVDNQPVRTQPDLAHGDALRIALAASSVTCAFGHRVWSVSDRYRVDTLGPDGAAAFGARQLVVAAGAHERIIPFGGWTLPGVMGLAAATILLKAEARLPGQKVVVAGRGPLLAAVAAGVIAKGGEVVAIVDRTPQREWLASVPALASQPGQLKQGAAWMLAIALRRVPILFGHRIQEALGTDSVSRVVAEPIGGGARRLLDCDALVVGDGLVPGGDIARLLRIAMRHDRRRGGWVPVVSDLFESDRAGLYCVGDGAGVRGAAMATISGEIAGLAVVARLGRAFDAQRMSGLKQRWRKGQRFSDAVAEVMAPRPADVADLRHDTVICRCEDVRLGEIDGALAAGAVDINQLKHFTRCGMGPCQGRMCGAIIEELLAARLEKTREAVGQWTGRPPLRPVSLGDLVGEFSYGDIPVPEPAPL